MGYVASRLDFGNGLSEDQKDAMLGGGDVILTACPGSGKTRSVAARVAALSAEGSRLALLSYTNVGADAIANAALDRHEVRVSNTSFVGTLHSFIGRYILNPFGHLLTGAKVPVRMNEQLANARPRPGVSTNQYRFDLAGTLNPIRPKLLSDQKVLEEVRAAKVAAAKLGVVSYDDAWYWAVRTLREFPDLAHALASRFDEVIVDEAQDSNEHQLEILRLLKKSGLKSLVLVGDFDQTIYQFNGSRPDLCKALASDLGLTSKSLQENYRSTQVICDLSATFRTNKKADKAVGKYANEQIRPWIVFYDPAESADLHGRFTSLLEHVDIQPLSTVILARSKVLKDAISGGHSVSLWDEVEMLRRAKSRPIPTVSDVVLIESNFAMKVFNSSVRDIPVDRVGLREMVISAVECLPPVEGSVADWVHSAVKILNSQMRLLNGDAPSWTDGRGAMPTDWANLVFEAVVPSVDRHPVDTIHGVKGRSVDAVLIAAAPRTRAWLPLQADVWSRPLVGQHVDAEELQIFYVGITRAQRLVAVALPDSTPDNIVERYLEAGFCDD